MLESPFKQPHRWAWRAIGTPKRFWFFQVQFFTGALTVVCIFLAATAGIPKTSSWWIEFGSMCVFVAIGMVLTPLRLLHALRAHMPAAGERGFEVVMPRDDGTADLSPVAGINDKVDPPA